MEYLPRRLELPAFDSADPMGWVFQVERYFEINGLRAEERLRAAMVCMEGEALAGYIWEEGQHPFCNWEEFKELLLLRSNQARRV